ncbi:MAG: ABC transporter ATP-binding protein [Candidatus Muiribacterium halophilum]|uniref:ABC transporter ATP-binding protein n=1 Tax=Muiribacterium halophilum TaxID=2053465 RepID=A0A2N5ZJC9_MUIH1|nr:MAG: ABC transporter ATP-binding protein [Candidatus Muirbacterium halophilum]
MNEIIKVKNVYKSFKGKEILKGLDLSVKEGECICIMGRSGCGKSVLMKIMVGLFKPDFGDVFYRDEQLVFDDFSKLRKYRRRFGMVFQNAALFDYLNVYDNIAFGLKYNYKIDKKEIKKIVFSVLDELQLTDSAYVFPAELSGGMKKRVALARALVLEPEILIYDEPTTGLDAIMVRNIDRLIKETQIKRNTTSIVITHDVNSAYRIADTIAIHSEGVIKELGTMDEIRNSKLKETRLILEGEIDE